MTGPRWKHDCPVVGQPTGEPSDGITPRTSVFDDACRYVGTLETTYRGESMVLDLYVHERALPSGKPYIECVARYSDDGPDYYSGPMAAGFIREYVEGGVLGAVR